MRRGRSPRRARSQLPHPQFHCGTPPPAAEPRMRTFIDAAGMRRGANSGDGGAATASSIRPWCGLFAHAGSVRPASPRTANAWHRQPPKSISRRSHVRHGSGIHAVPRYATNDSDDSQMSRSARSRTLSKRQRRDGGSRRTREHRTVRRDRHKRVAPAVHARFRKFLEVVGEYVDDLHLPAQAFPRFRDDGLTVADLLARRHQPGAILVRPSVKLRVGQLQAAHAEPFGQRDRRFDFDRGLHDAARS